MDIEKQAKFLSRKWSKYQQDESEFVCGSKKSVAKIENDLKVLIPQELILLSKTALNYRAWFAGIGEDYDNEKHILTINKHDEQNGSLAIPEGFIAINQGFDDDFDCISTDSCNSGVYYFDADIDYGGTMKKIADSFVDYLRVIAS